MKVKKSTIAFLVTVFFASFLVYFVLNFLPYRENSTDSYVQFSCRKDMGICEHEGKICFRESLETKYGKILYGPFDCSSGKEIEYDCYSPKTCLIYFTGIGCPHCAKVDPHLFYGFVQKNPIVLIEYEVYKDRDNAKVMDWYVSNLVKNFTHAAIPQIYINGSMFLIGDIPILSNLAKYVEKSEGVCELDVIRRVLFGGELDRGSDEKWFSGEPKIWYCNRVLVFRKGEKPTEEFFREFFSPNFNLNLMKEKFS